VHATGKHKHLKTCERATRHLPGAAAASPLAAGSSLHYRLRTGRRSTGLGNARAAAVAPATGHEKVVRHGERGGERWCKWCDAGGGM